MTNNTRNHRSEVAAPGSAEGAAGNPWSPRAACRLWMGFWFQPIDPSGLHAVRFLAGLLFLGWLIPFGGQLDALVGLSGWFDQQAYQEAVRLPPEMRPELGWSMLFLCGTNPILLRTAYALSLLILVLFTLGVATRLTSVLTWIVVVSFVVNPVTGFDADSLLVMLAFYLMIGYLLLGLTSCRLSSPMGWLGGEGASIVSSWRLGAPPDGRTSSVAANVALRLMQVHLAIVMVTTGLHKLQFGDWWAGVAYWYQMYEPLATTIDEAREHAASGIPLLIVLSLTAYATLGWQIAFPAFAWKASWRKPLMAGALIGWVGNMWLYELPLFGAVLFVGCLSYLSPAEWQRVHRRFAGFGFARRPKGNG